MAQDLEDRSEGYQIAIVGMSGRFPGAPNVEALWENVKNGVESVHFFTDEELLQNGESPAALSDPNYVRAWPVLDGIAEFDAAFFGMSPRDAEVMDPQHRLFLEVAWEALERAGYDPERTSGPVGVFAACGMNHYMMYHLVPNREVMQTVGEWLVRHTGNDMNFLATRVSYQMNLKGPSLNVQTACSSSLVAVHLACQSLLSGECDFAIAGASTLSLPQDRGYLYKPGEILSSDGHCRPFDAGSHGTLFGSGTGAVVLRRLADAERDGDRILAVIRGSAINNDGSQKVGYLAPSVEGQARAVAEAIAISGVHPETIGYIEAHGTGTAIGDPIEVRALCEAFAPYTSKRRFCAIGSIKANIGHLGEAAGMAGLIKTVLALQHRKLPPAINFERPNPEIDFDSSPFFVNTELRDFPAPPGGKRRAGLTALGAGGTNVHLILEEAPEPPRVVEEPQPELLVLSARTESALDAATARLAEHLEQHPELALGDVAYTLQLGRKAFPCRRALVATGLRAAVDALRSGDPKRVTTARVRSKTDVVFMFPGGGAQYPGMGSELYAREPVYRRAIDECLAALDPEHRRKVSALLLAEGGDRESASRELERPSLALPALFATEYAMAQLLRSVGVEPVSLIGHSMGEYVAACLAGVFSVADGMGLVTRRGRLFETLPEGAMLSVQLPEAELLGWLGSELSIAALNAPSLSVLSGPVAAIEEAERKLTARGIESQRIHISVAAHSRMLDPILAEFEAYCRGIRFSAPTMPVVSNLTGTWLRPEQARDPAYWVQHLRNTVRFADGIRTILNQGDPLLVEVGPGRTLASLARQQTPVPEAFQSLRHPREVASDREFLRDLLGKLWACGKAVDFAALHSAPRRRVPLPTYPFERRRYFIPAGQPSAGPDPAAFRPYKQPDLRDWFATAVFRESPAPLPAPREQCRLVFTDALGLHEALTDAPGPGTIRVFRGERYTKLDPQRYVIRAGARADYEALFEDLELTGRHVTQIVHLYGVTRATNRLGLALPATRSFEYDEVEALYFRSLLFIAQEIAKREIAPQIDVVTSNLYRVADERWSQPIKALVLGPVRVMPRELPGVRTRNIDVTCESGTRKELASVARALSEELAREADERVVALRGGARFVQRLERLRLERPEQDSQIRRGGVYLITGGLGGIGLVLARHLADRYGAKLALLGRTVLPPRAEYERWLREHPASDPTSRKLKVLLEIEAKGGEVLVLSGDAADREAMARARAAIRQRFGRLNGVIHAAGTLDDALISLKEEESARRVLAGKVKSAIVLDEVFGQDGLDVFVLFSSVSSILGLEGQVDYTAANAFLDAFAASRRVAGGPVTQAIGWNAWQEVGMAVSAIEATRPGGRPDHGRIGPHPCLERIAFETDTELTLATAFTRVRHWMLGEHVVRGGAALIPGTGFLELIRAGAAHFGNQRELTLENVTFERPFVVAEGESRDLFLTLTRTDDGDVNAVIFSDSPRTPHVTGHVRFDVDYEPAPLELDALRARMDVRRVEVNGFLPQPFMDFGPRWANVVRVAFGVNEALVELELPEAFVPDLASYELHPALLDMATGGAQAIVPGFDPDRDFLVPLLYQKLVVHAPLTRRIASHVRLRSGATPELAAFDVTIADEDGNVLVTIEGFTMKRVAEGSFAAAPEPEVEPAPASMAVGARGQLVNVVAHGISPQEGMDAFERVLALGRSGPVFASSVPLDAWLAFLDKSSEPKAPTPEVVVSSEAPDAGRAALRTPYVAPRNELEQALADMFRELLGVAQVGIHDDFFELGGQSLVAVRLFNKIRRKYSVDLPLSTLFEAPTVAQCAEVVASELGITPTPFASENGVRTNGASENGAAHEGNGKAPATRTSSLPPPRTSSFPPPLESEGPPSIRRSRWRSLVAMQPRGDLPPFFCVAGMGGTLNNLRKLALLAGDARPFFGLQPPGADGQSELLYTVEALAEHYIREIMTVNPNGPYLLGGYSGGGVAAFEIARRLREQNKEVLLLAFIDSFSPMLPKRPLHRRAGIHLRRVKEQGPGYVLHTIQRRLHYESWNVGRHLARRMGKIMPEHYRYENLADSWVVAEQRYRPTPFDGRAILFRAREESALSLWTAVEVDEQHGWGRFLKGGVEVQVCPGNHSTMCEEPNVRVLAAKLREAMDRVSPRPARTTEPMSRRPSAPPNGV